LDLCCYSQAEPLSRTVLIATIVLSVALIGYVLLSLAGIIMEVPD